MPQSDPVEEVRTAYAQAQAQASAEDRLLSAKDRSVESARRTEALALRMAGLSYAAIAERFEVHPNTVRQMIDRVLDRAEASSVSAMRDLENARLDRAQSAIWGDVINGDLKAIGVFLQISSQRAKMNGLYAPTQVQISMSIKQEMEDALKSLETLVLTESSTQAAAVGATYALSELAGE